MGKSILLVEDEARLAAAIGMVVRGEGHTVHTCSRVSEAIKTLDACSVSAAILDINVEDGLVYPVADELRRRKVPYAFCSSMNTESVPSAHASVPFLQKPFEFDELIDLTTTLVSQAEDHGD